MLAEPTIALTPGGIAAPLRNISIIVAMMAGASYSLLVKSVVHLAMISKSIQPKRENKRMI